MARLLSNQVGFGAVFLLWVVSWVGVVVGEVVPFIEPGFFFQINGSAPVTEQCAPVQLIWGRQTAIGQNPVAPYFFQIFTSTSIVPFIIDAGDGGDAGNGDLFFDFVVPFAPNTQYQICMYASNGVPGGCQVIYTMVPNTTVSEPTCQNFTVPQSNILNVSGTVDGGNISQNGFPNQCDTVSIQPLSGSPPFTLTVSPPNHPPYNITSFTMDPIVWTVSLSRAMPFWLSLVSSEGFVWANGPMGVGRSDVDICLAPDAILKSKASATAAGAGVGGLFGGLFLAGIALLLHKVWLRRRGENAFIEPFDASKESRSEAGLAPQPLQPPPPTTTIDNRLGAKEMTSGQPTPSSAFLFSSSSATYLSPSPNRNHYHAPPQLFVRHQDGGRVLSMTPAGELETAEVVELPPTYVRRNSREDERRLEEDTVVGEGNEVGLGGVDSSSRERLTRTPSPPALPEKLKALPKLVVP